MGGCFSSGGSGKEAPHDGVETLRLRVRPSDEDARWPYVREQDIDTKASVFIGNFHCHQSGSCDGSPDQQLQAPAA
ncbi:hypothetical protein EJB05_30607, partial [Eragrostis curvula]